MNNDSKITRNNNCYNYGNDQITNTFAQPGKASGHAISAITATNVKLNLTKVSKESSPK